MAGRGRGSGLSLTNEQMQALGVQRTDLLTPGATKPPPLYPKLENKPLPIPSDASMDYMILVKQQFMDHILETPAFVKIQNKTVDVERYSDKYKILLQDSKNAQTTSYVWSHMPNELRPSEVKIKTIKKRKLSKKIENIDSRLQDLEKREKNEPAADVAGTEKVKSEDKAEDEEEEVEDEDEEMDEGTDYVDNYFDNGDGFEDEDENLDDGPVY